jgi:hypothetical protein
MPSPVQDAVPQGVPVTWYRQPPTPSHMPSRPQALPVSAVHSLSGSVPTLTGRQSPSLAPVLAAEHALQAPVQVFSQQTPSTQLPDTQANAWVQAPPLATFGRQLPVAVLQ